VVLEFVRQRAEVLVLEDGERFVERELTMLVHRERLGCRLRGVDGPRPLRLDDHRLEATLEQFAGPARAYFEASPRTPARYNAAAAALDALHLHDQEPWALFAARSRAEMPALESTDARLVLLKALRQCARPTILVSSLDGGSEVGVR